MSSLVLIAGRVSRTPVARHASGGASFLTVNVVVGSRREAEWWNLAAFKDAAIDELRKLSDGDAVAAIGTASFNTYMDGGELRLARNIRAHKLLSLSAGDALAKTMETST